MINYKTPAILALLCILFLVHFTNNVLADSRIEQVDGQKGDVKLSPDIQPDTKDTRVLNRAKKKNEGKVKKVLKVNICLDIIPESQQKQPKSSFFSFRKKSSSVNDAVVNQPKESELLLQSELFEATSFKTRTATSLEITFEELEAIKESLFGIKDNAEKSSQEFSNAGQIAYWDNEISGSIKKLMRSKGYYASIVKTDAEIDTDNKIFKLSFYVYSRDRYKLDNISLSHHKDSNKKVALPSLAMLKSRPGRYVIAEDIISDQEHIISKIEDENCLFALSIGHEATINHRDHTLSIRYLVNAGSEAEIKEVIYEGLEDVNDEYLRKLVPLKSGYCFKRTNLVEARKILQTSGLFYSAKIDTPDGVDENKQVPVIFRLKERKKRSVKLGLGYGRDLGFGISLGWENRNLFSNAEELQLTSFVNQKEQFGTLEFTKPFFRTDNQKLKAALSAGNASHRAFDSKEISVFLGLERKYLEFLNIGAGGKFSISRIKEPGTSEQEYLFISAPLLVQYDRRDNILNSRKGYLLKATLEPFKDLNRKESMFLKNTLGSRYYLPFSWNKIGGSVLAAKLLVGSVVGNKDAKIPPNERFYAGGATSIRGYGFQLAGPLIDGTNIPTGGKSTIEASLEYRYMRNDNLGMVFFVDSGTVYKTPTPTIKEKLFHGVGFGVRYNTDFGPIRADIAFPTVRRKRIDSTFQIYFGIGQSF